MNLNLKMSQKLVMTPMHQQAIKLLPLARLELAQLVRQEIIDNPVLEEILDDEELGSLDDKKRAENDKEYDSLSESPQDSQEQEVDWENYFQNNIDQGMSIESLAEKPSIETTSITSSKPSILVTPIKTSGLQANQEAFGTGITESMITTLSQ